MSAMLVGKRRKCVYIRFFLSSFLKDNSHKAHFVVNSQAYKVFQISKQKKRIQTMIRIPKLLLVSVFHSIEKNKRNGVKDTRSRSSSQNGRSMVLHGKQ
jgi:hypothetical protein